MKITSDKPIRLWRAAVLVVLGAGVFIVACALDRWALSTLTIAKLKETDLFRAARVVGFLPVWGVMALALLLIDTARLRRGGLRRVMRRALLLFVPVLLSGIVGEALKLVLRRERPSAAVAGYVFRPWSEGPLRSSGMGLPSSHAMVAFSAAWTLCFLWPRAAPVWLLLAVGCGATRLVKGAHFLSDVALSVVVSYAVVRLVWACARRMERQADAPDLSEAGP